VDGSLLDVGDKRCRGCDEYDTCVGWTGFEAGHLDEERAKLITNECEPDTMHGKVDAGELRQEHVRLVAENATLNVRLDVLRHENQNLAGEVARLREALTTSVAMYKYILGYFRDWANTHTETVLPGIVLDIVARAKQAQAVLDAERG
jgi:hypothetical protein